MKTLDRILLIVGIFIAAFIISMIVIFCIFRQVPDTLITAVLGGGIIEVILTALITITKIKNGNNDDDN